MICAKLENLKMTEAHAAALMTGTILNVLPFTLRPRLGFHDRHLLILSLILFLFLKD